jgi:cytochrome c peroxidase
MPAARILTRLIDLCVIVVACSCSENGERATRSTTSPSSVAVAAPAVAVQEAPGDDINPRLLRRFRPLPASFEDPANVRTRDKVDLGRQLFFDARLSRDGTVACASCHDLSKYGVDGKATSVGVGAQHGTRNAPTVLNAAGLFAQFWDGRAATVELQAKGPILNPIEMAMTDGARVVATIKQIPGYARSFQRAFPDEADPLTFDNIANAIGAFERGLVTPGRWDQFLLGDREALTLPEKEGLKTFLNLGCMVCHTGPLLGGSMFERAGAVEPWPNQQDKGRLQVTHLPADAMMFKVPTLRNVEKTAPYFHDGSASTLHDAIQMMGKHQLGIELSEREIGSISAWMHCLTGDIAASYVAKPKSLDGS